MLVEIVLLCKLLLAMLLGVDIVETVTDQTSAGWGAPAGFTPQMRQELIVSQGPAVEKAFRNGGIVMFTGKSFTENTSVQSAYSHQVIPRFKLEILPWISDSPWYKLAFKNTSLAHTCAVLEDGHGLFPCAHFENSC
jgi:hypothetical protein